MTLAKRAALVPILAPLLALASLVAYWIFDPLPWEVLVAESTNAYRVTSKTPGSNTVWLGKPTGVIKLITDVVCNALLSVGKVTVKLCSAAIVRF